MNIFYFSRSTFISKSANSVHVLKMCHHLSNEHNVTLHGYLSSNKIDKSQILKHYDVSNQINMNLRKVKKYKILELFNLFFTAITESKKYELSYSRDLFATFFLLIAKVQIIYEIHDLPSGYLKKRILKMILKSKYIKKIVLISNALKNDILEIYNPSDTEIIIAHDASDDLRLNYTKRESIVKVGYIGSLYEGRGVDLIFKLAIINTDVFFYIIGGDKNDFIKIYGRKSFPDNLFFVGYVNQSQIKSYYNELNILLAPYQKKVSVYGNRGDTSRYMSPLKIFEYMASKTPMIVSNLNVLNEILTHEKNCLLVEPDNLHKWDSAIKRLIKDDVLAEKIAEQAYSDFIKNYTWKKRVCTIIDE